MYLVGSKHSIKSWEGIIRVAALCPALHQGLSTNYHSQSSQGAYIARDEDQKQVTELGSCTAESTAYTTGSYYHHNVHKRRSG